MLVRAKNNLARDDGNSPAFTIIERAVAGGIRAPVLQRGEDAHIAADDIIADHETRSARDEAVEWLRDLLADGPVAAKDVRRQAQADGISNRTLDRAKVTLQAISEPSRDESNISGWTWRLPDSHSYTSGDVDVSLAMLANVRSARTPRAPSTPRLYGTATGENGS